MNQSPVRSFVKGIYLLAVCLLLSACGQEESSSTKSSAQTQTLFDVDSLELTDANLIKGREIWSNTCAQCHLKGLGNAPIIGDKEAWAPRIAKGKETLYDHALNGFSGPLMLIMPPKGGFEDLSDEEVKQAVDFVIYASQ